MSKAAPHPAVVTAAITAIGTVGSVLITVALMAAVGVDDFSLGIGLAVAAPLLTAPLPIYGLARANHKLCRLRDELSRIAHTDTLTGLPNRRSFFERAGLLLAPPSGERLHAVMMVDIDRFKAVNDTLGHAAGDAALQAVADAIAGALPVAAAGETAVARIGGEEFAVVIAATSAAAAREVAGSICAAVRSIDLVIDGRRVPLTVSLGLALCRGPTDPDRALIAADEAVYRAKRAGRDRWVEATPAVARPGFAEQAAAARVAA